MQKPVAMRAANLLDHPHSGTHKETGGQSKQNKIRIGNIVRHTHRLKTPIKKEKANEQNDVAYKAINFRVVHGA
ncbi:hypothetical protein [Fibrobacter sp. UWH1]|uniref:hypothetical protein n=1 Tax=Fibrobacter sp. UWH1 TaxID=1964354 RepID=UPI001595906B|nr:hypothetical protein [Fibrobacter sp. UWH1]